MTRLMLPALSTSIGLFSDDAKFTELFATQKIVCLFNTTKDWGLSYNTNKCEALRTSRKRRSPLNLSTVNPYVNRYRWQSSCSSPLNRRSWDDC